VATGTGIVERYLDAIAAQDWHTLASCVAAEVERRGPYGEVCKGRDEYVKLLCEVMPALAGYEMKVRRVLYTADRRQAVAELSETVDTERGRLLTPEALVFDIDREGLIAAVSIYLRQGLKAPDGA
jgi:predicted ester cyclase